MRAALLLLVCACAPRVPWAHEPRALDEFVDALGARYGAPEREIERSSDEATLLYCRAHRTACRGSGRLEGPLPQRLLRTVSPDEPAGVEHTVRVRTRMLADGQPQPVVGEREVARPRLDPDFAARLRAAAADGCSEVCVERVHVRIDREGVVDVRTSEADIKYQMYMASPWFLSRSDYEVRWGTPERNRRVAREVRRAARAFR